VVVVRWCDDMVVWLCVAVWCGYAALRCWSSVCVVALCGGVAVWRWCVSSVVCVWGVSGCGGGSAVSLV
jgi:hypothetical protein